MEHIPLRYLIAFIFPITATIKPFLASKTTMPRRVEKMHDAWRKAVILQSRSGVGRTFPTATSEPIPRT